MKKQRNRAITALLVAALALIPAGTSKAQVKQPKLVAEVCVAVVVIGVGVYVVYKINKLCKEKLGPPPDGGSTNNPVPPPPQPPPKKSNIISSYSSTFSDAPQVEMPEDINEWDISTNGYIDPDGYPYTVLISFGLESSTNILNWQNEGSVTGWMSQNWIVTIAYSNSVPLNTNWTQFSVGCTNSVTLPIAAAPTKFFRTVAQ